MPTGTSRRPSPTAARTPATRAEARSGPIDYEIGSADFAAVGELRGGSGLQALAAEPDNLVFGRPALPRAARVSVDWGAGRLASGRVHRGGYFLVSVPARLPLNEAVRLTGRDESGHALARVPVIQD